MKNDKSVKHSAHKYTLDGKKKEEIMHNVKTRQETKPLSRFRLNSQSVLSKKQQNFNNNKVNLKSASMIIDATLKSELKDRIFNKIKKTGSFGTNLIHKPKTKIHLSQNNIFE